MSDAAPTVAVVGAGAWGTTLAAILAKREPVVLVTHRAEVAAEIDRSHRNERRLPGIDLPENLVASADPDVLRGATADRRRGRQSTASTTPQRTVPHPRPRGQRWSTGLRIALSGGSR